MKRIGITGPTGAGKTTALGALTDLGAHIIDADAVYHRLLEESGPGGTLRPLHPDPGGADRPEGAGQCGVR